MQKLKIDDILVKFPLNGAPQKSFDVTDPKNYSLYLITNIVNGAATSEFVVHIVLSQPTRVPHADRALQYFIWNKKHCYLNGRCTKTKELTNAE